MSSSQAAAKRSSRPAKRSSRKEDDRDRISKLPDDIVHKILGSLSVKSAVQTCVLSKRWKTTWKSLPFVDLTFKNFPGIGIVVWLDETDRKLFYDFIDAFVQHRGPNKISTLSLNTYYHSRAVYNLYTYALQNEVEEIRHHCRRGNPWPSLPNTLYTSRYLRKLKLTIKRHYYSDNGPIVLDKQLDLPELRSLHVLCCILKGENITEDVFALPLCPKLEKLKLLNIEGFEADSISIKAPYLKVCTLEFAMSFPVIKLDMKAPKLERFRYFGTSPTELVVDELNSLREVDFDLRHRMHYTEQLALRAIKMILGFPAKCLTITFSTAQLIDSHPRLLEQNKVESSNLELVKMRTFSSTVQLPDRVRAWFNLCRVEYIIE